MKTLTKRQREILAYIENCQEQQGITPSMREIADHFGFSSMSTAREHIQALCRKGALRQQPGQARALQVVSAVKRLRNRLVDVPLYGVIPAGLPDTRYQEAEGCITVDMQTLGTPSSARTFALQVRGDSMTGRHITDGDYVICEHGVTPRSGDIVAALIDNESTLKTFMLKNKKPYLRAENPRYPKLIPATELVIQGVVIAVIRKCREKN